MNWQPKVWIAMVLGLIFQSMAMLYLLRIKWAIFYFVMTLAITGTELYFLFGHEIQWLDNFSFNYVMMVVATGHAYWLAKHFTPVAKRPWYSKWYGMISIYIGVSFLLYAPIRVFFYEPFNMPSGSMAPTYAPGSTIIIEKWGYGNYKLYGLQIAKTGLSKELRRGDVIVFDYPVDPSIQYIKRVIGLPGDKVRYQDKKLTINDIPAQYESHEQAEGYQILSETYNGHTNKIMHHNIPADGSIEVTVPARNYFVMGDSRDNSRDSRYWGFVPAGNIVGRDMELMVSE